MLLRKWLRKSTLKRLTGYSVIKKLREICAKEQIEVSNEVLQIITENTHGDLRSAINDLQSIINLGEESYLSIADREKTESIFDVLKKLFQSPINQNTINKCF